MRALTSPARPPQQPKGGPRRSRARTGAPDGVSGGASWASAARQTRLGVTRLAPRSSRTPLDPACEHIADAGEGKRIAKTVFAPRLPDWQTKGGRIGAGEAMDAVRMGRRTA